MKKPFYLTEKNPAKFIVQYLNKYETLYYHNKLTDIIGLLPKKLKGKKVLDVGCCGGALSVWLAKKGAVVTGVDTSKHAINAAKLHARCAEVDITFKHGDIDSVKGTFDFVIAKDVIEHIDDDTGFLFSCNIRLGEGGTLILQTQNWMSPNFFIEAPIRFLIGQRKWKGWDPTHVRFYSYLSLKQKLKSRYFGKFEFKSSHVFPYLLFTKLFKHEPMRQSVFRHTSWFDKFFDRFGWSITVKCEKVN